MTDPDQQSRSTGGDSGFSGPADSSSYLKARTALTVYQAQDKQLGIQKKKGTLVDRARAEALMFRLARQERDAWVTWPVRVAALMAAEVALGVEKQTGAPVIIEAAILQRVLDILPIRAFPLERTRCPADNQTRHGKEDFRPNGLRSDLPAARHHHAVRLTNVPDCHSEICTRCRIDHFRSKDAACANVGEGLTEIVACSTNIDAHAQILDFKIVLDAIFRPLAAET